MSMCATQLLPTDENMYMAARLSAGIRTREQAESLTYIGKRTIDNIETNKRPAKPDEVLSMSDAYRQPQLALYHCWHECPIGQRYMASAETKKLEASALAIATLATDLIVAREMLMKIAKDGIIDEDERPQMQKIFALLKSIEAEIKSLEMLLLQEGVVGGEKERPPLKAAR